VVLPPLLGQDLALEHFFQNYFLISSRYLSLLERLGLRSNLTLGISMEWGDRASAGRVLH
jgi:hypothetical protein